MSNPDGDMIDLVLEFSSAMDGLDDRARAWLPRQGVPIAAIDAWPGPIGVAPIETHQIGIFDFAEHGRRALIMPVLSGPQYTDLVDLIAWFPDAPDQWWSRRYFSIPLGADQLDIAVMGGNPVVLQPTPLDWLRSNGDGVVINDWVYSSPQVRAVPIICRDEAHAADVTARLSVPQFSIPEIRIPKKAA